MGLESFGYLSDLVSSNPAGTDVESQGDDHIRGIKSSLQATFPNGSRAFRFFDSKTAQTTTYSISEANDLHKLIPFDCTSGAATANLPATTVDGWWCVVVKRDSSANAVTIDPSGAGTINGASTLTLTKQYQAMLVWWDNQASVWTGLSFFVAGQAYTPGGAAQVAIADGGSGAASAYAAFDAFSIHGANIASASTIDLDAATGNLVDVTGTIGISTITLSEGRERWVRFTGALVLTNSSSLVLLTAADLTTVAGDYACFRGYAAGVVRMCAYSRASGVPLILPAGTVIDRAYAEYTSASAVTGIIPYDDTIPQNTEGSQILSASITPKKTTNRIRVSFQAFGANNAAGTAAWTAALFQDSVANALAAAGRFSAGPAYIGPVEIKFEHSPGTVSAVTYKIRVGSSDASNVTLNGDGSVGRKYGAVARATLILEEIQT